MRRPATAALPAAVVLAAVLAGCGHSGGKQAGGASAPAATNPLTGRPGGAGRLLAVKVDNTASARPQIGLGAAAVVYLEQVEGGLTRLLAVFADAMPRQVGPVRSVRESDLELLGEYGHVVLAFSGGNAGVVRTVRSADVVDGSPDAAGAAYTRVPGRSAPYNLALDPVRLLAAEHGDGPRDIGLRFGPLATSAQPAAGLSVRFRAASVAFRYDRASNRWRLSMDGTPATTVTADGGTPEPVAADNVVVQFVQIRPSRYVDVRGNPTPYTVTTGSGRAAVFRDGRRLDGEWNRPQAGDPTHYTSGGQDIALHTGTTWILLVPQDLPLGTG